MGKEKNTVLISEKKENLELQKKVEGIAVFFEKTGDTPMHGRVFAYLLLADPPHKDFGEIQEFLNASKSAVSNALKFLQEEGRVDYIKFNGDRKRYFRVNTKGWLNNYKLRVQRICDMNDLLAGVLEERSDREHDQFDEQLKKIVDFQNQLMIMVNQFIKNWEHKNLPF